MVDVAAALGIACGGLGKIGRDLALLAQSEVRRGLRWWLRRIVVDAA
jgi:adenylosuccinate lyase